MFFKIPRFETADLPEGEKPFGSVVWHQFQNIDSCASSFRDAVELLNECNRQIFEWRERQAKDMLEIQKAEGHAEGVRLRLEFNDKANAAEPYQRWRFIAMRDGAVSLWSFLFAVRSLKTNIEKLKSTRPYIKLSDVNAALIDLRNSLPQIEGMRHAVCHTSELLRNPDAAEKNMTKAFEFGGMKSKGGGMWTCNSTETTLFSTTFDGKTVAYDLTADTLAILERVGEKAFSAFNKPSNQVQSLPNIC